jgi:hypothetical protein
VNLLIAVVALGAVTARADVTAITPTGRGWLCDIVNTPCAVYGQPGMTQANNGTAPTNNIFTGSARVPNDQGQSFDAGVYRDWFQFAIPTLNAPLVGATLTLPEPNRWNTDTRNYNIYQLPAAPKVFADVNTTGKLLGTVTTTAASFGSIAILHFNADGLAAITAAQGGTIYLGGIDDGEKLGGYHGDFSGTGPIGVDYPPYPNLDRHTPLTLITSPWANQHTGYCTTPPTSIPTFTIEHLLDVTTIQTTLAATIAPQFLPMIFSPAYEVRTKITYIAASNYFNNDIFVVPAGSPLPTPASYPILNNRFAFVTGLVDNVYLNCTPYASFMLTGRYVAGQALLGNPTGAPFAFSAGYNVDDPDAGHRFRDLAFTSSGIGMTFEAYAYGTITLPQPPAVPPPPSGNPTISVSPSVGSNGVTQVHSNPLVLDASQSADPNGQALTYLWSSSNTVLFTPTNTSATPQLTFQAGFGDYPITLTVTNASGASTKTSFVLQYVH